MGGLIIEGPLYMIQNGSGTLYCSQIVDANKGRWSYKNSIL